MKNNIDVYEILNLTLAELNSPWLGDLDLPELNALMGNAIYAVKWPVPFKKFCAEEILCDDEVMANVTPRKMVDFIKYKQKSALVRLGCLVLKAHQKLNDKRVSIVFPPWRDIFVSNTRRDKKNRRTTIRIELNFGFCRVIADSDIPVVETR